MNRTSALSMMPSVVLSGSLLCSSRKLYLYPLPPTAEHLNKNELDHSPPNTFDFSPSTAGRSRYFFFCRCLIGALTGRVPLSGLFVVTERLGMRLYRWAALRRRVLVPVAGLNGHWASAVPLFVPTHAVSGVPQTQGRPLRSGWVISSQPS